MVAELDVIAPICNSHSWCKDSSFSYSIPNKMITNLINFINSGNETVTNCHQLKMRAADMPQGQGRRYDA